QVADLREVLERSRRTGLDASTTDHARQFHRVGWQGPQVDWRSGLRSGGDCFDDRRLGQRGRTGTEPVGAVVSSGKRGVGPGLDKSSRAVYAHLVLALLVVVHRERILQQIDVLN